MKYVVPEGKCVFCGTAFGKAEMERHLRTCPARKALSEKNQRKNRGWKEGIFTLLVEGSYLPIYWMYLDVAADSTLKDLDSFLRDIWLECCGHLSAFTIDKKQYLSQLSKDPLWSIFGRREEFDMNIEIEKVLRPRLKFFHEYDFGTTTELVLKVVMFRKEKVKSRSIRLLARNDPPSILCDACGAQATKVCACCIWSEKAWFCNGCAKNHDCGEEMFLPVVNSPRVGMCGYTGPFSGG